MTRAPTRLAGRRLAAWGVDWLTVSLYAGALVPLGLLLVRRSVALSPLGWNALSFAVLVLPVTLWLAAWEAGAGGATPGKRLLGLRVRTLHGDGLPWRRALARNAVKVMLPWELGHTAAFLLADSGAGVAATVTGMVAGCAACALGAGYVAALFIGAGRPPYDRAAGSRVDRRGTP